MELADIKKDVNDADLLRLARDAQSGRDIPEESVSTESLQSSVTLRRGNPA